MLQLPIKYKPENSYAAAWSLLRNGMFAMRDYARKEAKDRPGTLPNLPSIHLADYGHVSVYLTSGNMLDQGDLTVFLEVLDLALDSGSNEVRFFGLHMLNKLGTGKGKNSLKALDTSLHRLHAAQFKLDIPGITKGSALLHLVESVITIEDENGRKKYAVKVSNTIVNAYKQGITLIPKAERARLADNPLAQGLHAFYTSQDIDYNLSVERIRQMADKVSRRTDRFMGDLDKAIARLEAETGWKCRVEKGMLKVEKTSKKSSKTLRNSQNPPKTSIDEPASKQAALPLEGEEARDRLARAKAQLQAPLLANVKARVTADVAAMVKADISLETDKYRLAYYILEGGQDCEPDMQCELEYGEISLAEVLESCLTFADNDIVAAKARVELMMMNAPDI